MRLCLFAFIGSDNLGDEAIFEVVYGALQSLRPERLTILSLNPERTLRIATAPNVRVMNTSSPRDTARAIGSSDALVVGGGGMFHDHSSIYNPLWYLSRVQLAHLLRTPVFIYASSAGPFHNRINGIMTGRILGQARRITVRDNPSRQTLLSLGVAPDKVRLTADPVLNYPTSTLSAPRTGPWRNIVVCLRHWFDIVNWLPVRIVNALHIRSEENVCGYERFVSEMARVLDYLLEEPGASITFVPFWGSRDTKVHDDVARRMKEPARCNVLRETPPAVETNAILAKADLVLPMRLHSLIFTIANARPFFAIDYSRKVGDCIEEVLPGKSTQLAVSPEKLDATAVIESLRKLKADSPFGAEYVASVARIKERERETLAGLRGMLRELGLMSSEERGVPEASYQP
ncbi:MAG: hypothetical protein RL033_4610 [Pseudomonadota bacterium]|jgi:polysaccharide pyruvyl transferase CsaB